MYTAFLKALGRVVEFEALEGVGHDVAMPGDHGRAADRILLAGFYEANLGTATGVVRDVPVGWAMIVSQLGMAAVVTFVLHHARVATARGGLKIGAAFGVLFGIAIAFDLYAVTNWSTVTVAFVEPFVTGARIAVVGVVIGWVLGFRRPVPPAARSGSSGVG